MEYDSRRERETKRALWIFIVIFILRSIHCLIFLFIQSESKAKKNLSKRRLFALPGLPGKERTLKHTFLQQNPKMPPVMTPGYCCGRRNLARERIWAFEFPRKGNVYLGSFFPGGTVCFCSKVIAHDSNPLREMSCTCQVERAGEAKQKQQQQAEGTFEKT